MAVAKRVNDLVINFRLQPTTQRINESEISQVVNGPGVRNDLRRRAENVMNYQKSNVGVKTGRLRDSIRIEEQGGFGVALRISVVAGRSGQTPQLGYQMDGTRPHTIRPRRVRMLHFYWERVGQEVWLRKVSHPGSPKNDFVSDSTRYWRP